ncbi:MAG: tetratricopeptide repeat protein [Kofleriaceae bacterium]|nr:tetratricopeptide repeat protein [Kofleriaceae bacterium]
MDPADDAGAIVGATLWALVTAIRFRHWVWAALIVALPVLGGFAYFFFHLHAHAETGFELPGARDRQRIKRLEEELARLDKPHLHAELGDLYFQQNQLERALRHYRTAHDGAPRDLDTRAHLGGCLVRLGRAAEALPLLESVVAEKPRHDHGFTLMALAEAQATLDLPDDAIATWRRVLAGNSYGRARVQLAELLAARGEVAEARALLDQVTADHAEAPDFHRRREAVWAQRARRARARLPAA